MIEPVILSLELTQVAIRMANEGIPVGAISRSLGKPGELVRSALSTALSCGHIVSMPRPDWPPTGKLADHIPQKPNVPSDDTVMFVLRKLMRLTPLEAEFLQVLMKFPEAEKEKLHAVVENLRTSRAGGYVEPTDPKMVDVMICKLRKRLTQLDPGLVIKTMWGRGYYIEEPVRRRLLDHVSKLLEQDKARNGKASA